MICRIVLAVLIVAYLGALLVYVAGWSGWSGVGGFPLSVALLIVLGMPWLLVPLTLVIGEAAWPAAAIAAPIINLIVLHFVCRRLAR